MNQVTKIIIRFPNWLGDIVMALPLLEALHKSYPKAVIHALVRNPFGEVLREHPLIAKIHTFDLPKTIWSKLFSSTLSNVLKKEGYDLGILCTNSFSSALVFKKAQIPQILGSNRFLGKWVLTHIQTFVKKTHQREKYLKLLEPLNIQESSLKAPLCVNTKTSGATFDLYEPLGIDFSKPYILIHPGASYGQAKTWPLAYYETLALEIIHTLHTQVIFLGDLTTQPSRLTDPLLHNLAGKTSLHHLCQLIAHAQAIICNDSGPMHIADALNTPLIALFGATDPALTGPLSATSMTVFNKLDCGPCFKRVCPLKHHACMQTIEPAIVFKKLTTLLAAHGTS